MKARINQKPLIMTLFGALAMMLPNWAIASTAPCTQVSNAATLAYKVGAVDQTPITSAPASFNVGVKVIAGVTNNDGNEVTVSPGAVKYALKFTVQNDGNAVHDYALAYEAAGIGTASPYDGNNDSFDGATIEIYEDATADGVFNPADDGAAITSINDVAADGGTKVVYIVYTASALSQPDLAVAVYSLKATSQWADGSAISPGSGTPSLAQAGGTCDGSTTVDVLYGDAAGTFTGDGAKDGAHSDDGAYEVSIPTITVTKGSTVIWDPINYNSSPKAIPGALVEYVITVNNSGAASATLTAVTDTLVAALAIDPDLKTNNLGTDTPTFEDAVGNGFKAKISSSTRVGSGTGLVENTDTYYSTANDADGIDIAGQAITATMSTILDADTGGGAAYAIGELKTGETLTITFNVLIQ